MSRRGARIAGWVVASVLGLVAGAVAALNGLLIGLFSTATPAEEAERVRWYVAAAAAPVVSVGGYTLLLLVAGRRRSRRRRD
jgi:hypothetical protein